MFLHIEQLPAKPGSVLMREDFDLLQAAERGDLPPTLRFYEWEEPTISLGFHQDASVLDDERISHAKQMWVRRPTGGAAVMHSQELTYSIILSGCTGQGDGSLVQQFVSEAIAKGLQRIGVAAEADARGEPMTALPNRISCFVRTSRWEVTAYSKKIVGSAQRRLTNAILQHGSILVGNDHLRIVDFLLMRNEPDREKLRNKLAEKATSASEQLGRVVSPGELRVPIAEAFTEVFSRFPIATARLTEDR
ncbi:hypothetical protein EHM69_04655 [candidate division KSB1 bacterium]|nr:MAG: hypothetical protein EHM69_04655 [candidate division KSB1 bacterium]